MTEIMTQLKSALESGQKRAIEIEVTKYKQNLSEQYLVLRLQRNMTIRWMKTHLLSSVTVQADRALEHLSLRDLHLSLSEIQMITSERVFQVESSSYIHLQESSLRRMIISSSETWHFTELPAVKPS